MNRAPRTDPTTAPAIVPADVEELEEEEVDVADAPERIVEPLESTEKLEKNVVSDTEGFYSNRKLTSNPRKRIRLHG